jgi:outer membrane protein
MKYSLCAALAILASFQMQTASAEADEWNAGLAVTANQSPFVGGATAISALPVLIDRSDFDISGPAWSFNKTPQREFYIGAGLDEWDYQRGDSAVLQDMHALNRAINVRAGAAWKLASGSTTVDVAQDVAGAHKGAQAKLRYTYNPGEHQAALRPYVEAQWLSSKLTDYYVGVNADEAKAGRPAYKADAALALKAGVKLEKPLSKRLSLVGGADLTRYGSAITDSPIVDRSTVWGGYAGMAYRW